MTSYRQEWQSGLETVLGHLVSTVFLGIVGGEKTCLKASISSYSECLPVDSLEIITKSRRTMEGRAGAGRRRRRKLPTQGFDALGADVGDSENTGI